MKWRAGGPSERVGSGLSVRKRRADASSGIPAFFHAMICSAVSGAGRRFARRTTRSRPRRCLHGSARGPSTPGRRRSSTTVRRAPRAVPEGWRRARQPRRPGRSRHRSALLRRPLEDPLRHRRRLRLREHRQRSRVAGVRIERDLVPVLRAVGQLRGSDSVHSVRLSVMKRADLTSSTLPPFSPVASRCARYGSDVLRSCSCWSIGPEDPTRLHPSGIGGAGVSAVFTSAW